MSDIINQLEDLGEKLILAESNDLPLLGQINSGFEKLAAWAKRHDTD